MPAARRALLDPVVSPAGLARVAFALFAAGSALPPVAAHADAVGPEPPPIACPAGGVSAIENWMRHGQRAYCAPSLAPRTGPLAGRCREGYRAEALELSISGITPSIGGHYGGPPIVPTDDNTLARLDGPCDAPDDEPPIAMDLERESARGGFGGPSVAEVPVGCHRFWVWIADPSVHCPVEPVAPPTDPVVPSGSVPAAAEPAAAREAPSPPATAEATPPARISSAEPPPASSLPTVLPAPPAPSGSRCACSAVGASARTDVTLWVACVGALGVLGARRTRLGAKGTGSMRNAGR